MTTASEPASELAAEPAEVRPISLEELKLISDPLRTHLLEALVSRPRTVKELAADFGLPATRLYYHINLLEKHGLIRVTGMRIVSGIIEKRYRAVARQYHVDSKLFAQPQPVREAGLEAMLAFALDATKADIHRSVHASRIDLTQTAPQPRALLLRRGFARLTPAQAKRIYERLLAVLKDFTEVPDEGGAEVYSLVCAFYPTEYHPEET
ncbi:MAG: winged helix-turn-helix domain-containing protein [Anaerolineales bacterium]|nr:winged helix-turn-helix domain-containing protein [Anaerolineales bacterium]